MAAIQRGLLLLYQPDMINDVSLRYVFNTLLLTLANHSSLLPLGWSTCSRVRVVANIITTFLLFLLFALPTSEAQTSGRCITHLAKMSIDPKLIELTADVFRRLFYKDTSSIRKKKTPNVLSYKLDMEMRPCGTATKNP